MFLHGYLATGNSFIHQIRYFSRFFDTFAPDLKGFGDNFEMPYPYALDDYINDIKEYMYKNSIVRPSVIAHSFGGRIAIKCAAENERFFNKLVLTGAAGLKPKKTIKKTLKKATFNILKRFISKEKLYMFYSDDYNALSPIMKESFKKIVSEYLDEQAKKIKNDTLIIFGENDTETPIYMAKKLNKAIQNSKLKIFSGAGHFCFIDKPLTFNTEVMEFLLS